MSVIQLPQARADEATLKRLKLLSIKAMESFDLLDIDAAKKLLNGAVAKAKTSGLENEPIVARIYLNLGIVYFSGDKDPESAKVAFIDAVKIDPNIEIDPGYKTSEMQALLEEVKGEFGGGGGTSGGGGAADCSEVSGLSHTLIDTTEPGKDTEFEVLVGADVNPAKVALHYRFHGIKDASEDYAEVKMKSDDNCKYAGTIPGDAIVGGVIHYYIAAYNDGGKTLATKGTSRTPNLIEIGDGVDSDNPFATKKKKKKKKSGGKKGQAKVFINVAAGTGGAFVTGETEQVAAPVQAGFAPAYLHVFPELGYFLSPQMSLSFAFRMGFTVGANRDMHATAAPSGVLRLRRSLSADGDGVFWSAAVGGGVIRQIVQLTDVPDPTMDVDTTAVGPLIVGGGAGFQRALGGPLRFIAELNMLLGIPVVEKLGTAVVNFGVQFDLNLGFQMAF